MKGIQKPKTIIRSNILNFFLTSSPFSISTPSDSFNCCFFSFSSSSALWSYNGNATFNVLSSGARNCA